jgi:hypothetical protein
MADRLNLDPGKRQTVHADLAQAWKPYSTTTRALTALADL